MGSIYKKIFDRKIEVRLETKLEELIVSDRRVTGVKVSHFGRTYDIQAKHGVVLAAGGFEWMAMGRGIIDFVGQFRAMKKDGYRGPVVLETHWRGAGTAEESTRQSMAGMKELLKRAGTL